MEQLNLLFSTKAEHATADNGARVEVGTVTHCGREFAALGSVVDHSSGRVVGYVKGASLTTWDGAVIGTVREISSWRPRVRSRWGTIVGATMHAYVAVVDGKRYHGRGQGEGMVLSLRACKVGG